PTDADHADAAATRRSGDGDDRVVRREHDWRLRRVTARPFGLTDLPPAGDDDRLHERIADALGADARILGYRQVDDPALVGIQRSHFLWRATRLRLLGDEVRHLLELRILVASVVVAVDDDAIVFAKLAAEGGRDEMLKRLQPLAAAADENPAV